MRENEPSPREGAEPKPDGAQSVEGQGRPKRKVTFSNMDPFGNRFNRRLPHHYEVDITSRTDRDRPQGPAAEASSHDPQETKSQGREADADSHDTDAALEAVQRDLAAQLAQEPQSKEL